MLRRSLWFSITVVLHRRVKLSTLDDRHFRKKINVCVCICVCCLLPLSTRSILWLSGKSPMWGPNVTPHTASSPPLTVQLVRFTVVVVEGSVAVVHVAIFRLSTLLAIITIIFIRLSLLFVAPLVLDDVLSGQIFFLKIHQMCTGAGLRWKCCVVDKGEN